MGMGHTLCSMHTPLSSIPSTLCSKYGAAARAEMGAWALMLETPRLQPLHPMSRWPIPPPRVYCGVVGPALARQGCTQPPAGAGLWCVWWRIPSMVGVRYIIDTGLLSSRRANAIAGPAVPADGTAQAWRAGHARMASGLLTSWPCWARPGQSYGPNSCCSARSHGHCPPAAAAPSAWVRPVGWEEASRP